VFVPATVRAGEFFQRAGTAATHAAFVASRCLRTYVIDSNGKEHVLQFAPETWWVADATSLATGSPSQYFIDAVEDSQLLLIDPPSHERVVESVPGYAAAFRRGLQKHAAAKDERIVSARPSVRRLRTPGCLFPRGRPRGTPASLTPSVVARAP
jgi:CRP-like cAMP-binding protein